MNSALSAGPASKVSGTAAMIAPPAPASRILAGGIPNEFICYWV
jgi:hypothetical protein